MGGTAETSRLLIGQMGDGDQPLCFRDLHLGVPWLQDLPGKSASVRHKAKTRKLVSGDVSKGWDFPRRIKIGAKESEGERRCAELSTNRQACYV